MRTGGQQATTLGPSIYHTVPSLTAPRGSTDDVLRRSDEDQHLGGLTNRFLACSIDGRRLRHVLPSFRRGRLVSTLPIRGCYIGNQGCQVGKVRCCFLVRELKPMGIRKATIRSDEPIGFIYEHGQIGS
jgi:hypothetical protein